MENKDIILIVGIVLLVLIIFSGVGMMGFGSSGFGNGFGCLGFGNRMMSGIYGSFGLMFGWIFMIVVLVALILFIVWLIKQLNGGKTKK